MTDIALSPIRKRIQDAWSTVEADPQYQAASAKLNKPVAHQEFISLKEHYAIYINYYAYRRQMKALKIRHGALSKNVEATLASRGTEGLAAYRNSIASLERYKALLDHAGLTSVIDKHSTAVFENFDHNPKTPAWIAEFRAIGVPEDAIGWVVNHWRESKFDLLHMPHLVGGGKLDGTFGGLVKHAGTLIDPLEKDHEQMKIHGLVAFTGSGSDSDKYAEAGAVVAVAIIVGICCGF